MNSVFKKIIKIIFFVAILLAAGYGGYKLYNFLIEDAIKKIQQGVSKGVRKGIIGVVNPFKW